jgi:hypothetical protein
MGCEAAAVQSVFYVRPRVPKAGTCDPSISAALLCGMTPVSGHGERAAVCLLERVNASSLTWPGSTGASEAGRTIGGRRSRCSGLTGQRRADDRALALGGRPP